jgi:hypothetical protein
MALQFVVKVSSMEFHENLHGDSRAVTSIQIENLTWRTHQQLNVEETGYEGVGWIEVARLEDFLAILTL